MVTAPAQSFEDLIVWQKSHQLTLLVYRVTALFRNLSCMDWFPKCGELQCQSRRILPKDSSGERTLTRHGA